MYLGLRTADIYENNSTKVKFNPVRSETNSVADEFLIIKNISTEEKLKIPTSDFKNNYSLVQSGSIMENSFFI